jgi:hypothetical protein
MKLSNELSDVLKQACLEAETWQDWQRSRDPQGVVAVSESQSVYPGCGGFAAAEINNLGTRTR